MKLYELSPKKREKLREKVRNYALSEFDLDNTIKAWHETMSTCIETWRDNYDAWESFTI